MLCSIHLVRVLCRSSVVISCLQEKFSNALTQGIMMSQPVIHPTHGGWEIMWRDRSRTYGHYIGASNCLRILVDHSNIWTKAAEGR